MSHSSVHQTEIGQGPNDASLVVQVMKNLLSFGEEVERTHEITRDVGGDPQTDQRYCTPPLVSLCFTDPEGSFVRTDEQPQFSAQSIETPHGLGHAPSMLAVPPGSKIFDGVHQILLVQVEPVLRILSVPNHGPVPCREFCGVVVCPWTKHVCCDLGGGRVVIGQASPRRKKILFQDIFFGAPRGKVTDQVMEAINV